MELGALDKVDLRAVWSSEASDFTPWLAGKENLARLGPTALEAFHEAFSSRPKEFDPSQFMSY